MARRKKTTRRRPKEWWAGPRFPGSRSKRVHAHFQCGSSAISQPRESGYVNITGTGGKKHLFGFHFPLIFSTRADGGNGPRCGRPWGKPVVKPEQQTHIGSNLVPDAGTDASRQARQLAAASQCSGSSRFHPDRGPARRVAKKSHRPDAGNRRTRSGRRISHVTRRKSLSLRGQEAV
jgi:hypothetical protein